MPVHLFLQEIPDILRDVAFIEGIGYAGYSDKTALQMFLEWAVPGDLPHTHPSPEEVKTIINAVLEQCRPFAEQPLHVFVFPTYDPQVRELGAKGFSPWKNTIILNVYPVAQWQQRLREVLGHEIAHAIAQNHQFPSTIGEWLVWEGLAERFREANVGGESAPWVEKFSRDTAFAVLKKLDLDRVDGELYKDLFFGSAAYPRWIGYAIGYWLTEHVRSDWKEVLRTPLKTFLPR